MDELRTMVPYLSLLALFVHVLCIGVRAHASLDASRRSVQNIAVLFFYANIVGTPKTIRNLSLVEELQFTRGYNKIPAIVFALLFLFLI